MSGKLPNAGCYNVADGRRRRQPRNEVDGLHRLLRQGHAADDDLSRAPGATAYIGAIAATLAVAARRCRRRRRRRRPRRAAGHDRRAAPVPPPTGGDDRTTQQKPKKKRGFWGKLFGTETRIRRRRRTRRIRRTRRSPEAAAARDTIGRMCPSARSPVIGRCRDLLARAVGRGTLPPSLIFAGPDGVGKRLTAIALAQALNCERPASRRRATASERRLRRVRRVPAHRARRPRRRARHRARRLGHHQARSGARRDRSHRLSSVRRARAASSSSTRRDALNARGAERAAQDARRAAAGVGVRAGDRAARRAAADRAVAVPAPALRSARAGRRGRRADARARLRRGRRACGRGRGSDGSIGRALEGSAEDAMEARDAAARLLQSAAASSDPRRRLDGAKALVGGGGDRDDLSRRLLALSSLIRDLGLLQSRADERALANSDLRPQLAVAAAIVRRRPPVAAFATVDRALGGARPQRQPEDRRRLAGAEPSCPTRRRHFVSVKFTPAGRTVSFLLPDLSSTDVSARASRWSSRPQDGPARRHRDARGAADGRAAPAGGRFAAGGRAPRHAARTSSSG